MKKLTGVFAVSAFALAGTVFAGDTIYSIDNGTDEIGVFDSDTPGTWTSLGNTTGQGGFINGLEFDGLNDLYGSNGSQLFSVNLADGVCTAIGSHGLGTRAIGGMSWDPVSGTMYGIDNEGFCSLPSRVVTIDLGSGAASVVCDHPSTVCSVGFAVDASGVGYVQDVSTDSIHQTDLGTCAETMVTGLGYDANYGQEICVNLGSGDGYILAFNLGTFIGEFWTWNVGTGATSYVGLLGGSGLTQMGGGDVQEGEQESCLQLTMSDTLTAGDPAFWTLGGGTPGERGVVAWGTDGPGSEFFEVEGWCAEFDFAVRLNNRRIRIVGSNFFDGNGEFTINRDMPPGSAGLSLHFQGAERNTCPGVCQSQQEDRVVN